MGLRTLYFFLVGKRLLPCCLPDWEKEKQGSLHSSDLFLKMTKPQNESFVNIFTIHLPFHFEFLKILVKLAPFEMKPSTDIGIRCKFRLKQAVKSLVIFPLPKLEFPASAQNRMKTHCLFVVCNPNSSSARKEGRKEGHIAPCFKPTGLFIE